jgi:hypothetical protein
MKDYKTRLLILVSLLLMVCSLALLWTWGYQYGQSKLQPIVSVSPMDASVTSRDSLNSLYNGTIWQVRDLDNRVSRMDSIKWDLNNRIDQFQQLKKEVLDALRLASSPGGLSLAHAKIKALQQEINKLKAQNRIIQRENKRMQGLFTNQHVSLNQGQSNMSLPSDSAQAVDSTKPHSTLSSDFWVDSIRLKLEYQGNSLQLLGEALLFNANQQTTTGFLEVVATSTSPSDVSPVGNARYAAQSGMMLKDTIAISSNANSPIPISFLLGTPSDTSKRQYRIQFLLNGKLIHLSQTSLR